MDSDGKQYREKAIPIKICTAFKCYETGGSFNGSSDIYEEYKNA